MTAAAPRRVTRGYVGGLIAAVCVLAAALVIGGWGGITYFTGVLPVETPNIWVLAAEVIVLLALAGLAWALWHQALVLLRGRRTPSWAHVVLVGTGVYVFWSIVATFFGMSIEETWLSPFALVLAIAWALASIIFWAILARRVYTDRPTPKWPWESPDEGPDTSWREDLPWPKDPS